MNRLALYSLSLIVLSTASAGCVNRANQAQNEKNRQIIADPLVPVEVKALYPQVVNDVIDVNGSIVADDDTTVGALSPGKLVAVLVKDGDVVSAGQVIARQESADAERRLTQARAALSAALSQVQQAKTEAAAAPLRTASAVKVAEVRLKQAAQNLAKLKSGARDQERKQAEIQVERAESDLKTSKLAVDRARKLFNEGAISKQDLEALENRYDNAMAAYRSALETKSLTNDGARQEDIAIAQQELAAAQEAVRIEKTNKTLDSNYRERVSSAEANVRSAQETVSLAQKAISDTIVRAPIAGRISGRPAQVGSVLSPGFPVARIVGLNNLFFEPEVTESQVARVNAGMGVAIRIDALGGDEIRGIVDSINPQASSVGRLYKIRVRLLDMLDRVKPGMFGKGNLVVGSKPNVYIVPDEAIQRDGDKAWVLVNEDGVAARRPLRVFRSVGSKVEADGLKVGDQVVTRGQVGLLVGAKLKIVGPDGQEIGKGQDKP